MTKTVDSKSTKTKILRLLREDYKGQTVKVIKFLNMCPEDVYEFRLKETGTHEELIDQMKNDRKLTQEVLFSAVCKAYEIKELKKPNLYKQEKEKFIHHKILQKGLLIDPSALDSRSYDIGILNLDQDPNRLVNRMKNYYKLRNDKSLGILNMNALFWGPSGTGKTQLAKYLSHRIGKKVFITSASSFLDSFVGSTEKNIRDIFLAAEKEDWILFIDEVEGLIPSRGNLDKAWEKTQVNEFLVRVENFRGVCIAATNLYESIDDAFLRRFSEKVKFGFLDEVNRMKFLKFKFARILIKDPISNQETKRISAMKYLTPGDIQAVYKRIVLDNRKYSWAELVFELEAEMGSKKHIFSSKMGLNV